MLISIKSILTIVNNFYFFQIILKAYPTINGSKYLTLIFMFRIIIYFFKVNLISMFFYLIILI